MFRIIPVWISVNDVEYIFEGMDWAEHHEELCDQLQAIGLGLAEE